MAIRKRRTSTGGNKYAVSGREHLHFLWNTPKGQTLQVSLSIGLGNDGREFLSVDVMHDPAADVEFSREPGGVDVILRLPVKGTPMGIMHHAADWTVGQTEIKKITPAGKVKLD